MKRLEHIEVVRECLKEALLVEHPTDFLLVEFANSNLLKEAIELSHIDSVEPLLVFEFEH
jgi:hypothetical protein